MPGIVTLAGESFEPDLPKRLLSIANEIRNAGGRAFLVGGWVRDALLGKDCRDYDIEVYDLVQDELVPILKKYGRTNLVGKAFGVIHLAMKGLSLDFSFPRTESKVGYGHRGFVVHTDEKLSFKEAALRRDFTINAMGMELPELTLCDPYGGIDDLKKGLLRHVGPAFVEDSLRILRGVQFASRFALKLAPETIELCRTLSLEDLSIERLFEEFKKWLLKPGKPSLGLCAFLDIKLNEFFPEVSPLRGSWEDLGEMLDNMERLRRDLANADAEADGGAVGNAKCAALSDNQVMEFAFASFLSGCPETSLKFLERITNESHLVKNVPLLLNAYSELDFTIVNDAPALRRMAVKLGGLKLLCLLVKATPRKYYAAAGESEFPEKLWQAATDLDLIEAAPQPFLMGKMLMEMGFKPGKEMGETIKQSFELQLDGKIKNAEEAIEWVRSQTKERL
jgi:tRNA nucleotidyltransferase (CCA-adding enzyme)